MSPIFAKDDSLDQLRIVAHDSYVQTRHSHCNLSSQFSSATCFKTMVKLKLGFVWRDIHILTVKNQFNNYYKYLPEL